MSHLPGTLWRVLLIPGLLVLVAACATQARTMDQASLDQRFVDHAGRALTQRDQLANRLLLRLEYLHQKHTEAGLDEVPTLDVLLLSSGGQYGAFGAGVLAGWREADVTDYEFPRFDIVTGISTGAMIAPFAISGEAYSIQRVSDIYRQADKSLAELRGWFFFWPWHSSLYDTRVLRQRIEAELDEAIIADVAQAHVSHRMLLIGAVDLDLGRFHIWDMGPVAAQARESGDLRRFHDAMISSASIPGAFPPIEIDGVLYADGAAAQPTFLGLDRAAITQVFRMYRQRNPQAEVPRMRMWMIVNGHVDAAVELAEQRWASVAIRAAEVMSRYAVRTALRNMQLGVELVSQDTGVPVEFRYLAVPSDVDLGVREDRLFDRRLMQRLYDMGYMLGRDPASWRTEAISPDIPGSTIIPREVGFEPLFE